VCKEKKGEEENIHDRPNGKEVRKKERRKEKGKGS
jgi:hypothetical protein